MSAPIPHAVLMCHAPIVLPQVGKGRAEQCRVSTEGMRHAAQHLKNRNPDVVVVLSPHTPRMPHAFGLVGGQQLQGDFANFGAPEVQLSFQNDMQARAALLDAAAETKIDLGFLSPLPLDHGAAVPWPFCMRPIIFSVVVIGFPSSHPCPMSCHGIWSPGR